MEKKKLSTKKKASIAAAVGLIAALLVGGAYAWTDYSQTARNTFKGNVAADVLLHDDFNGENKDVYVENTGDNDVYVRVKFAEYLQIGNNSVLPAYGADTTQTGYAKADPENVATWPVHQFENADAANICDGDAKDAHNYYEWNMSGAKKAYLAGVTEADADGMGGLSKDDFEKLTIGADFTLGTITTHKNNTLPEQEVMLLSDYLALAEADRPTNGCWLLDTDGWCYWSKALAPDTATNLLLDEVLLKDEANPYDNWLYHIDVQLQAASVNEMNHWYRDGNNVEVADPDNSVATTTENGFDFIQLIAGDYINDASGLTQGEDGKRYFSLGNNVFHEAVMTGTGYEVDSTKQPVVAGMDKVPGNADDNLLAGRTTDNGGAIAIASVNTVNTVDTDDTDEMTYTIDGTDTTLDIVVTAGVDKLLGTYDDVLTSPTGQLGTYEIDGDATAKENVGWIYLGGNIDNMLVATEYVLDNVKFNAAATDNNYYYDFENSKDSVLKAKIDEIGGNMGIANGLVVPTDLDMSICSSNYVMVCTKESHSETDHTTGGVCTNKVTTYYTTNTNTQPIENVKFFALSIDEIVKAYGDISESYSDIKYRRPLAAPAYVNPEPNKTVAGSNANNSTYTDGDGNIIVTTAYWLRSPGYESTRAGSMGTRGQMNGFGVVNDGTVGARPACYFNLAK